jgi:hypothetical protein
VLFAVYPVAFAYAHNLHHVTLSQTLLPLAAVLAATALLWPAAWLLCREWRNAGVVVSLFLLLCFSFGHVADLLLQAGFYLRPRVLLGIWLVLLLLGAGAVLWRRRRPLVTLTRVLNVVSVFLVAMALLSAGAYALRAPRRAAADGAVEPELAAPPAPEGTRRPDIYYIILDRYLRGDMLQELCGFDNREFLGFLQSKGFYVASASWANYLKTAHSLVSSLNLEHLQFLTEQTGARCRDWGPLYRRLQSHRLARFLKRQGYQYLHFGSWWNPTAWTPYADRNVNYFGMPEFASIIYSTTLLRPLLEGAHLYDTNRMQWKRIRYQCDELAKVPDLPGPKFVFAHLLIPHPPYVFRRDGSYKPPAEAAAASNNAGYVDQVVYINQRLRELVETWLAGSEVPPIIVLQSDEGRYPWRFATEEDAFDWRQATTAELREKFAILNALHLPGLDPRQLRPDLSPVNTFRIVLNAYFGTQLDLLPDESYAFVDQFHLYEFFPVTDTLRGKAPSAP